jgi:hypothetical protein
MVCFNWTNFDKYKEKIEKFAEHEFEMTNLVNDVRENECIAQDKTKFKGFN